MPPNPATDTSETAFAYVGGDAGVDLVNTVNWTERGLEKELLGSFGRLARWAEGAGLLGADEAAGLERQAAADPCTAAEALDRARRLRAVLQRLLTSVAAGSTDVAAWHDFNAELAVALGDLRVAPRDEADERGVAAWTWRPECPLHTIASRAAWSAANLLTSPDAARLRTCAGPDCGWMFVDRSRNGLRRWCEMATCGTDAKTRRRRRKQASQA